MRKIAGLLACGLAISVILTGCGKGDVENTSEANSEVTTDLETSIADRDEIFVKIDEANTNENLTKLFDRVACSSEKITADGVKTIVYVYYDKTQYVIAKGDDVTIDKNGNVYRYDPENDLYIVYCFVGDSYKYIKADADELVERETFEHEKVSKSETKDGRLIVEGFVDNEDEMDVFAAIFGIEEGDAKQIRHIVEVDEKTYVLHKQEIFITTEDKEFLVYSEEVDTNPAEYHNEAMEKAISNPEKTIMNVIVGNGTDKEKKYTFEVPKGTYAMMYSDNDLEDVFYMDKEYTKEYDGSDVVGEGTFYVKYK